MEVVELTRKKGVIREAFFPDSHFVDVHFVCLRS
jgi:hypothetical protein